MRNFNVIGVMSGTSLDGVDLIYVKFNFDKEWNFKIIFSKNDRKLTYNYSLKKRRTIRNQNKGFDSSDVVYLITPDRYANGNLDNDIVDGLKESLFLVLILAEV